MDLQFKTEEIYSDYNQRKISLLNELNSIKSQIMMAKNELDCLEDKRRFKLKENSELETTIHEVFNHTFLNLIYIYIYSYIT